METKHKEFKPFDKVLVRRESRPNEIVDWRADIFSHIDNDGFYVTIGLGIVTKNDILPYEGNEHLVGTTDEPEEEVELRKGEWVMVSDEKSIDPELWRLRRFDGFGSTIRAFNNANGWLCTWGYAIKFSDFNPNDMEETKKHILCVKNGKIVKYKG